MEPTGHIKFSALVNHPWRPPDAHTLWNLPSGYQISDIWPQVTPGPETVNLCQEEQSSPRFLKLDENRKRPCHNHCRHPVTMQLHNGCRVSGLFHHLECAKLCGWQDFGPGPQHGRSARQHINSFVAQLEKITVEGLAAETEM